jgi:hypothetical protein
MDKCSLLPRSTGRRINSWTPVKGLLAHKIKNTKSRYDTRRNSMYITHDKLKNLLDSKKESKKELSLKSDENIKGEKYVITLLNI